MNVPLLRAIQQRILAEPDAFRMDTWTCGTAHCIAGWALHLSGLRIVNVTAHSIDQRLTDGRYPDLVATELLDLDDWDGGESSAADHLFNVCGWPDQFERDYAGASKEDNAASRAERARIAVARIEHFIATDGAE